MITFATLWLGIAVGALPVEVLVGPEVARVELRVDGTPCATLEGPPWSTVCDLGPGLAPHELVAVSLDAGGARLGEARQWLNLPRAAAELEVALAGDGAGGTAARLAWAGPAGAQPLAVRAWVDGQLLPAPVDPHVLALPAGAPGKARLLRVEAEFADGVVASRDVVFGGPFAEVAASDLTAVPLVEADRKLPANAALRSGDHLLPVLALDRGEADLVVVTDPAALGALETLARSASRGAVRRSGTSLTTSMRQPGRDTTNLPGDVTVRQLWPARQGEGSSGGIRFDVFPISLEMTSRDGTLLSALRRVPATGTPPGVPRLADAVAVAGMTAAGHGRRRAVILVLGQDSADASIHSAESVRRYLQHLRVPLFVWVIGNDEEVSPGWGEAFAVTSVPRLLTATRRLFNALDRQRIAWVEGRHLPQLLAPSSPADWQLAGATGELLPTAEELAAAAAAEARDAEDAAAAVAAAVAAEPAPHRQAVVPDTLATRQPLGPFTLVTDVADRSLLDRLAAIATALPDAYGERLGVTTAATGDVLLFAREEDFRAWLAHQGGASDGGVEGFAASGVAGLYVGARDEVEVGGLLVHELSHLITRGVAGRPLPPWLEEGLAEELAMSRFDGDGQIVPGSLRTERVVRPVSSGPGRPTHVERLLSGPAAALVKLVGSPPSREPLTDLLAAEPAAFTRPEKRQQRYATAAFFVRFLLAPAAGRRERFHTFFAAAAAGGAADEAALVAALGEPLATVEEEFVLWLRQTALAGGE
jgi:hypothetical protein